MPFRESNLTARASGRRWLRRIFIEDWGLKLLALAITLVLWFVVSGRDIQRELAVEPHLEGKPARSFRSERSRSYARPSARHRSRKSRDRAGESPDRSDIRR